MIVPPYEPTQLLKLCRLFSGLSQIELAERLGITQGWLSRLETGEGELTLTTLVSMRQVFGITADAFIDGLVPFLEIAERFGNPVRLPSTFAEGTSTMRQAYPLLRMLSAERGDDAVRRLLKRLRVPAHYVAEPRLRLHRRFHVALIEACEADGLPTSPRKLPSRFIDAVPVEGERLSPRDAWTRALRDVDPTGSTLRLRAVGKSSVAIRGEVGSAEDARYMDYVVDLALREAEQACGIRFRTRDASDVDQQPRGGRFERHVSWG